MAITNEQRRELELEAQRHGVDVGALISEAEALLAEQSAGQSSPPGASDTTQAAAEEPGNLFMYLLPFVTVGEVRRIWLKVDGPFPADDNMIAAEWAARFAPGATPTEGE